MRPKSLKQAFAGLVALPTVHGDSLDTQKGRQALLQRSQTVDTSTASLGVERNTKPSWGVLKPARSDLLEDQPGEKKKKQLQ